MRFIILLFSIFFFSTELFSEVRWNCKTILLSNIATVGDSRAEGFVSQNFQELVPSEINFLQEARLNGKPMFPPKEIVLQNLATSGTTAKNYVDKIKKCQDEANTGYIVPKYTLMSLGGNDIINYLKEKYKNKQVNDATKVQNRFENYFKNVGKAFTDGYRNFRKTSLKGFLRSPFRTLASLVGSVLRIVGSLTMNITGNPLIKFPDYSSNWEWQDNTAVDKISADMEFVITHFLEQSANHNVMLNVVQPAGRNSIAKAFTEYRLPPSYYIPNVIKMFNKLRTNYTKKLYPRLEGKYRNRILLVDTYNRFYQNILTENETFYSDGIHFTGTQGNIRDELLKEGKYADPKGYGNSYWGDKMAVAMAIHGWFRSYFWNVNLNLFTDLDMQHSDIIINQAAMSKGIDEEFANLMPPDSTNHGFSKYFPRDPFLINTYYITGVDWDFEFDNDIAFYIQEGNTNAISVRGDIRLLYDGNGGPDGIFGYPLGEETTANLESFRTQNFECGTITKNYFDLLQPNKLNLNENLETCKAKKARDAN